MFRLTVEKGDPAGTVFELKPGENTLGRSRAAGVHLQSLDVSGLHARIRVEGGVARLENLSQFGTRLDDVPVTGAATLTSGQRIAVGKTTVLLFQQSEEAGRGATPNRPLAGQEAKTGEGGAARTPAAQVTRADPKADSESELTGALSRPDVTSAAGSIEGMTRAMQTRAATPEEIEHLKLSEQKRVRRRMLIGLAVAVPALILVFIFRPRTPPPELELEWPKDAGGTYLDAFEPAPSGGFKDGGYDLQYPDNKTFKKTAVAGGVVLEGWVGRNLDVRMRIFLQEESEPRLAAVGRAEMVDDWIQQMSASGGRWNFDKPAPSVTFFGKKNGVPFVRATYLRDGNGSWFGTASIVRHGCRRIVVRAEVPAVERVRAENLLTTRLLRVSDDFESAHWEHNPVAATLSEDDALAQVRKDLERTAPATWVAMENLLTGLLTKTVQAGHKESEEEALRHLVALRGRQALWFNSQQLAFDDALSRGNVEKALKIAEFTKAVFSNMDDQRYFTVRKWKAEY